MITAKQAKANSNRCNKEYEENLRNIPEFKRMSKYINRKIRNASKLGYYSVYLSQDEISIDCKLTYMKDFFLNELKDFLKEKGFRLEDAFTVNTCGFVVMW